MDFLRAHFCSGMEWCKSVRAPQGLNIPPAIPPPWDAAPQVPCTGLGHASDTQILPPEPSTTPKKEKDTDGEKEKKEKGLDFPSCPNEGAKHPKSSAEKHREKHKERWGLLPAVGGHQPHGQGIGGADTRTPSARSLRVVWFIRICGC